MEGPESDPPSAPPSRQPGRADPLDRIRVVLVEPQGPRNVGAVARAMRNFGLERLFTVGGVDPRSPESREMAVHAGDILDHCEQAADLDAALGEVTFVVGTTAKRRERLPTVRPREAAARILDEALRGEVALVFGRENHGLDAEELGRSQLVVSIATAPDCRALNLAQAVLILAYEIYVAAGARGTAAHSDPGRLLTDSVRQRLHDELMAALRAFGIVNPGNEIPCARSLGRILALGPMQMRDARLLFTLARRVTGADDPPPPAG